jgi:serine/threonine protein kinase
MDRTIIHLRHHFNHQLIKGLFKFSFYSKLTSVYVHHPNILQYLGIFLHADDDSDELSVCIVSEYHKNGNLTKKISDGFYNAKEFYQLMLNVAEGLQFIHDRNSMHGDLKPESIQRSRS